MKTFKLAKKSNDKRIIILKNLFRLIKKQGYTYNHYDRRVLSDYFTAITEIGGCRVILTTKEINKNIGQKCDIFIGLYNDGIVIYFNENLQKDNIYLKINSDKHIVTEKYATKIFDIINNTTSRGVCFALFQSSKSPTDRPSIGGIAGLTIHPNAEYIEKLKKRIVSKKKAIEANQFSENKNKKSTLIELFYGTNRLKQENKNLNKVFGSDLSELTLGVCKVLIPNKENHREGEIERPFKLLNYEFPEKEGKHFILNEINVYQKSEFVDSLSNNLVDSEKTALIFIHGYNTTFAEAAYRTAQIVYDLPFKGVGSFFSWPSTGKKLEYLLDVDNASSSITELENFIKIFLSDPKIEKLHLIAHSMGNRVLSFTLMNLSQDDSFKDKLEIIQQIVLGAPDISQDEFKNVLLPKLKQINARKTLYASDKDEALDLSQFLRSAHPRLGQAGENIFISEGLDTIDATNVPSNTNGHSYIFDTKELLTDLFLLFKHNSNPNDRRLREESKNELKYWLFPLQK